MNCMDDEPQPWPMRNKMNWDEPGTPPTTTRIVCMSDLHTSFKKLVDIPEGDILLIAGDLTCQGREYELIAFNEWLDFIDMDHENGGFKHKVVIPGNHDLFFEENWECAEALVPAADVILDGELYDADGINIYGEPRQPEFFDWAFNVPRDKMKERVWDKIPEDKPIDILLTHGPPWGVRDYTIRGAYAGCRAQREWILKNQPRLVVCGHIHYGYGLGMLGNTLVVNAATCAESYKPVNPPIVVDI